MDPNKVYKSLVYLAYNVIKNERLRYELDSKVLFRYQFVKQINNMLALEKDFNQNFQEKTWTTVFAKAIVKITAQKQRFEKHDGLSVEEIYADYSSFLSYTSTTFEVGRNTLTEEILTFTEGEVLIDAVLTEQIKLHYQELEKEKLEAEIKTETKHNNYQQDNNNYAGQNNNTQSFFGGQFGHGGSAIVHPMQNPRFYPYNSKPTWMPKIKYGLAMVVILATIMLIAATVTMMALKINLGPNEDLNNPYGKALFGDEWNGRWEDFLNDKLKNQNFPLVTSLMAVSASSILSLVFYSLPAVYIGYVVFKKPRSLREKYRLSIMALIFMMVMFVVSALNLYRVMSSQQIAKNFDRYFTQIFAPQFKYNFQEFWKVVMANYGGGIRATTIIADIAMGLLLVSLVTGLIVLILNPRLSREKMARATMEYQKAMGAMMQGHDYEMDPSLFDVEEPSKPLKTSKFSAWFKKTFKKKIKDKSESNQTHS